MDNCKQFPCSSLNNPSSLRLPLPEIHIRTLLLDLSEPALNDPHRVKHSFDLPDAYRSETSLFCVLSADPPVLNPTCCLIELTRENHLVFLANQISHWHHYQLVNVNLEIRWHILNLLQNRLLLLNVFPDLKHFLLLLLQFLHLSFHASPSQRRCENTGVMIDHYRLMGRSFVSLQSITGLEACHKVVMITLIGAHACVLVQTLENGILFPINSGTSNTWFPLANRGVLLWEQQVICTMFDGSIV